MNKQQWMLAAILFLAAMFARAQTVEYIHTDALGSPVAVTNASGVVVERTVYEPYGAVINRPVTNGPGYTGHVMDAVTGLNYMQQRYYDPQLGRFLSNDPVTATSVGANFNRYWYANNNPYKFTDPDGRAATCTDTSCQIVCESIVGCAGDYIYVGGVYVIRLIESAMQSEGGDGDGSREGSTEDAQPTVEPGSGASGGERAGKDHTRRAKEKAREINRDQNGGKMVCPDCGSEMTEPQRGQPGVTPDPKEAVGDHVEPKSQGGDGATAKDMRNIKTRCRECNGIKSDNPEPPPLPKMHK